PAERCVLGPVDRIFTRIGASDDLAGGRSTFMVEMTEAANILHHASDQSLVLLDEIGRGTGTFDGLALAWATAAALAERIRAMTLFATHYFELTELAQHMPFVANVHLDVREHAGSIVFMHRVEPGPANRSYGLQVAQLAGVPGRIIDHARRILARLERDSGNPDDRLRRSPQLDMFDPGGVPGDRDDQRHDGLGSGAPASVSTDDTRNETGLEPLRARLREIQPDELTPRAALDLVYELKTLLREAE
ncbi:MAG: DNA mismatch repair protein MutS, partial [Gammaproteobacteria bacterium]|nr:DNA mismatch repair protein MutS [Gammaproteobacteria bacterium]